MEKEKISFEQFFAAIGESLTLWWLLEEGLRDIFTRLVMAPVTKELRDTPIASWHLLAIVFHSSSNLRSRLQLITDLMAQVMSDQIIIDEWNSLQNRVIDLYKRRNIVAHGVVFGLEGIASEVVSDFSSTRKKRMNYYQVKSAGEAFRKQADRARPC